MKIRYPHVSPLREGVEPRRKAATATTVMAGPEPVEGCAITKVRRLERQRNGERPDRLPKASGHALLFYKNLCYNYLSIQSEATDGSFRNT